MSIEERLNEQLNELQGKLEAYEEKEEQRREKLSLRERAYLLPRMYEETELTKGLPVPRIEMVLEKRGTTDWTQVKWTYGFVSQPYANLYERQRLFTPISQTAGNGKYHILENGKLDRPWRDEINMQGDMYAFNLRGFIVCPELSIVEEVLIEFDVERFAKLVQK